MAVPSPISFAEHAPAPDRPFVGRTHEMAALEVALRRARERLGSLVLLVGDAGIGKTRTAEELARRASASGVCVHWGRCHEGEGAPPYWPWLQLLRGLGTLPADAGIETMLGAGATGAAVDPDQARFRLFEAVAGALRDAAKERPLLLVVDDLQWADRASLRLLEHLSRELRQHPILILGTCRPEEMGAATLARAERIPLGGLPDHEITRLVEAAARGPLPVPVARAIERSAEGNPFFALELVAALEGARPDRERVVLPEHLRDVIRRRLLRLPADTRGLLAAAAVMGREFDVGTLARVSGGSAAEIVAGLDPAVEAGVVVPVPDAPGKRRFSHVLICGTLDADLPAVERATLHRRIGEVLEAMPETSPAELAHHFRQAAVLGDVGRAVEYGERAGRHALAQLAYEEAVGHFEGALALRPEDPATRLRLLLALGDALWRVGDARARPTFLRAAELARGATPSGFGAAVIGYAQTYYTETGIADPTLHGLLEEALRVVPPAEPGLRARLLGRLASALYLVEGAEERRLALSEEALDCARRSSDPTTIAAALLARHTVRWVPGTTEERLALVDEVIASEARGADVSLVLRGLLQRVEDLLELGDAAAAERALAVLAQRAGVTGDPVGLWYAHLFRANLAILSGRFDEAEQLAGEALAMAPAREGSNAPQFFAMQLFFVRREQGRVAELEPRLAALAAEYANLPVWRCGLLLVHLELDRRARVAAELAALGADGFASLPRDVNWVPALVFCVEAAHAVGDAPRAEMLFRLLEPHASRAVAVGSGTVCLGSVARAVALAATTAGREADARRYFEEALLANARMGARPFLARTQHEFARLLAARGRPSDAARAVALTRAARRTAEELGMQALLASLDAVPPLAPRQPPTRAALRPEGDYWTVTFEGETRRLRDSKGLRYLAELLRRPGRPMHVAELVDLPDTGDDGEWLDAKAIRAYRARADVLRDDLEEAAARHDVARAARLREELTALSAELAHGLGIGGQRRRAGSPVERARVNVVRRIAAVLRRLDTTLPALARYLRTTISTGTLCTYTPDPRFPVHWEH